jgi:flagellar hook-associated protein 3 FlgL
MRVTYNGGRSEMLADIQQAASEAQRFQRQVSSGYRVQVPSDDPSATVAAINENSEIATLDRYVQATDSVGSRLSVADTVLSDMVENLTSAQASAAGASQSGLSDTQREVTASDLEAIRDALITDFNTAFRGSYLFSGTASTMAPYLKAADGSLSAYQGNQTPLLVDIDRQRSVAVSLNGAEIATGTASEDVFAVLQNLATAVRAADSAGITDGLAKLKDAFDRVTRAQSGVGKDLGDLDNQKTRLNALKLASTERLSKAQDTNMVEAISGLTNAQTAYKAALSAASSELKLSLLDYLS